MSTNKQLREIAALLPPAPKKKNGKIVVRVHTVYTTGREILKQNPNARTAEGEEINPEGAYPIEMSEPVLLNHFDMMKGLLRHGPVKGPEKVNLYIDLVFKYNGHHNPGIRFVPAKSEEA